MAHPLLDPTETRSSATLSSAAPFHRGRSRTGLFQGVNLPAIFESLQGYFGQQYVNDFNALGRSFQVYPQAESSARDAPRTYSV